MQEEVKLVLADLLDYGCILLFRHASEVARQGEVDSLQLDKGVDHLCRADPGVQDQSMWEGCMLLQHVLQPAKGTHAVHLNHTKTIVVACRIMACKLAKLMGCCALWCGLQSVLQE